VNGDAESGPSDIWATIVPRTEGRRRRTADTPARSRCVGCTTSGCRPLLLRFIGRPAGKVPGHAEVPHHRRDPCRGCAARAVGRSHVGVRRPHPPRVRARGIRSTRRHHDEALRPTPQGRGSAATRTSAPDGERPARRSPARATEHLAALLALNETLRDTGSPRNPRLDRTTLLPHPHRGLRPTQPARHHPHGLTLASPRPGLFLLHLRQMQCLHSATTSTSDDLRGSRRCRDDSLIPA